MDHSKELTHLSLCTGHGGIDLGLKRVVDNVRTIAYVEIEAFQCANLVSKMEKGWLDAAPIWTDLKTFPWSSFYGKVDILSGGFPCQPFSSAGRRDGDEDPRHLWPYIKRGIQQCRPSVVFLENVEGIISSKLQSDQWSDPKGTSVLLHVLRELERLGYQATAGIFSAAEVGAPHQRKRVFIMGQSQKRLNTNALHYFIKANSTKRAPAWPSLRGQGFKWYEPPKTTMGHTNAKRQQRFGIEATAEPKEGRQAKDRQHTNSSIHTRWVQGPFKSKMGRLFNGASNWVDLSKLFEACESRTDELRSLGNGVVPSTAAKAFIKLHESLCNSIQ